MTPTTAIPVISGLFPRDWTVPRSFNRLEAGYKTRIKGAFNAFNA